MEAGALLRDTVDGEGYTPLMSSSAGGRRRIVVRARGTVDRCLEFPNPPLNAKIAARRDVISPVTGLSAFFQYLD